MTVDAHVDKVYGIDNVLYTYFYSLVVLNFEVLYLSNEIDRSRWTCMSLADIVWWHCHLPDETPQLLPLSMRSKSNMCVHVKYPDVCGS
jgi:hypothetical protein